MLHILASTALSLIFLSTCSPNLKSPTKTDSDKSNPEGKNPDEVITVTPPVDVSGTFLASAVLQASTAERNNYVLGVSIFCDPSSQIFCDPSKYDPKLTSIEDCKIFKDGNEVKPAVIRKAANVSDFWQYEFELATSDYLEGKMTVKCGREQLERVRGEAVTVTLLANDATSINYSENNYHDDHTLTIGSSFSSLLRFDLSTVPAKSLIRKASFFGYAYYHNLVSRSIPITAYRMLKPWIETIANSELFDTDKKWHPWATNTYRGPQPGYDFDDSLEDVFILPHFLSQLPRGENTPDPDGLWLTLTMTRHVISWLAEPKNNFGIYLGVVIGFQNNYSYGLCSDDPIPYKFATGIALDHLNYDDIPDSDAWLKAFQKQSRFCTPEYSGGESRVPKLEITYYP